MRAPFVPALDAYALTLSPDRFSEIGQLIFHDVVDCVAGGIDVITHLFDDVVDRDPVDQLLTALHRSSESTFRARTSPARSFRRAIACPSSALQPAPSGPLRSLEAGQAGEGRTTSRVANQWPDRTAARWASPKEERDSGPYRSSDQCRGQ